MIDVIKVVPQNHKSFVVRHGMNFEISAQIRINNVDFIKRLSAQTKHTVFKCIEYGPSSKPEIFRCVNCYRVHVVCLVAAFITDFHLNTPLQRQMGLEMFLEGLYQLCPAQHIDE